jgi:hypothetical protein
MKICKKCGIEKDESEFYKRKIGYEKTCKKCRNQKSKENYIKNKEEKKEYQKKWNKENKEKIKIINKENHSKNRDRDNEMMRKWYNENEAKRKEYREKNKDEINETSKKWRIKNKEKLKEYGKKYREDNKEKRKEYLKKYNIEYRIKNNWIFRYRYVLRGVLDRIGLKKESHTIDLLGYSSYDFKIYIENLFDDTMSWDKKYSFEIDHIIPITHFREDTPQNIINALDNLMPLKKEINNKKSNFINFDYSFLYEKYSEYIIPEIFEIIQQNKIRIYEFN